MSKVYPAVWRHTAGVDCSTGGLQNVTPMLFVYSEIFAGGLGAGEVTEVIKDLMGHEYIYLLASPLDWNQQGLPLAQLRWPTEHIGHLGDNTDPGAVIAFAWQEPHVSVFQSAADDF